MKRIAILFEYPSLNGGENSMLAVLQHLRDSASCEAIALAPPTGQLGDRLAEQKIAHRPLSMFEDGGQRRDRSIVEQDIREALDQTQADLIHGNSLSMGRLLGRMSDSLSVPVTAHLRDIIGLSGAAIRDLNRTSRLIAVSDATRSFHLNQGMDADRIAVIHNGIDAKRFECSEESRREMRQELGIPADAVVMLTAGQIGLRKGLNTLAEAAVRLSDSLPGLHWMLAGERFSTKAESIEFEHSIDAAFRSAEPRLTYHRLGWRSDMPRVMSAADVLVHAARQEPLGRVILEASAAGLAIVATDVGGTSEIVQHGESALLVPADEPGMLAEQVGRFVESPDMRSHFGNAACERIREEFPIDRSAHLLADIWMECCS